MKISSEYISSTSISLEIKLNDGEIIEAPLIYASYGFSENIYRKNKRDGNKIKKSLEKYLSKNKNLPLVIAFPEKDSEKTEFKLIPRNSINYIKLIYKK